MPIAELGYGRIKTVIGTTLLRSSRVNNLNAGLAAVQNIRASSSSYTRVVSDNSSHDSTGSLS